MRLRCVKYAATRPLCTNRYQFIINPRLANARVCASAAEPAANGASPQQVQPLQAPIPSGNIGPLDNLVKSTPMPRYSCGYKIKCTIETHQIQPHTPDLIAAKCCRRHGNGICGGHINYAQSFTPMCVCDCKQNMQLKQRPCLFFNAYSTGGRRRGTNISSGGWWWWW